MTTLDDGLCVGSETPDLWFADLQSNAGRAAAAICAQCPVATLCRSQAVRLQERFGIWGGKDALVLDKSGACAKGHDRAVWGRRHSIKGGWRCTKCEYIRNRARYIERQRQEQGAA